MKDVPTAEDVMKILDAVYDVQRSSDHWLDTVLRRVLSTLDSGAGAGAVLYDISTKAHLVVDVIQGLGISKEWCETGLAIHQDPELVPGIILGYSSLLCATLPELTLAPEINGRLQPRYDDVGCGGQIMINGVDCSGKGCALFVFSSDHLPLSSAQRDIFCRLATHLATGYRLQRGLAASHTTVATGVEAVFTPTGRVDHAEAPARSSQALRDLQGAVRLRERARVLTTTDPERAVRSSKGLVNARWTLIDQCEPAGRRYIVARENAPKPHGPALLSTREQQVVALATLGRSNKFIAYELGLAHSTVRVLMARACVKLRAKTRAELITRQRSFA